MARLTIDLPADLEAKLEIRLMAAGYSDSESYLRDLVAADTNGLDVRPPSHLSPQTQDELESMLIEGLHSGARVEITAADWEKRREDLIQRHSGRDK